jgi:GntR family transcriptional regulator
VRAVSHNLSVVRLSPDVDDRTVVALVPGRGETSYQLVARELRAAIRQGVYADGRALPTEADLAATHRVSRQTIRRAFQDLVAEGLVARVPGRGTFARPGPDGYIRHVGTVDDLMGLSEDTEMRVVEPLARRIDVLGAGRLHLTSDAVFALRLTRSHDGTPFCVTAICLPPAIGRELATVDALGTAGATSTVTVIGLLDARLGIEIAEAQQSISVELANETHSADLGCAPGHPLLRIDRLYLDTEGNVVELAISHFLPEHYSYRINLRRGG